LTKKVMVMDLPAPLYESFARRSIIHTIAYRIHRPVRAGYGNGYKAASAPDAARAIAYGTWIDAPGDKVPVESAFVIHGRFVGRQVNALFNFVYNRFLKTSEIMNDTAQGLIDAQKLACGCT
jgi:hypothetical protein